MKTYKPALLILLAALVTVDALDILPPIWYPGDVLGSTIYSKIENALKDVDRSIEILNTSNVALGIASMTGELSNPCYHLVDGQVHANVPYNISAGKTGLLLFTKTKLGIKGVYGVVTYDVKDQPLKVAVMFSVPFNCKSCNPMFHFRVFSRTTPVDKVMVRQMYKYSGAWSAKGWEDKTEYGIHMTGIMTENNRSRLIVWVEVANADITKGPTLNTFCDKKGIIGSKLCRRECAPTGCCWTSHKCRVDYDCPAASLTCSGSCDQC